VFAYGSAYALTREGWAGHASGRLPLMHHDKALIITPTLFCEADYKADWEQPMLRIIDDWGLRYPGVKHVEHVFFYGAAIAGPPQIQAYLHRARQLGRDFAAPPRTPALAGASAQEGASEHAGYVCGTPRGANTSCLGPAVIRSSRSRKVSSPAIT
jgi:hypothetical protein